MIHACRRQINTARHTRPSDLQSNDRWHTYESDGHAEQTEQTTESVDIKKRKERNQEE